jgi:NADH-quinone oxidoreductase subunit E
MLTEEERVEIETELKRHYNKRAACFEALRIVQRRRGWVSDEIREIADLLDLTPEELDSVATFYTFIFRRPVGKHVIYLCDSISCWVMGYEDVLGHIKGRLGIGPGETTDDGQFTLIPVSCIGTCDHAPAMMIDGETYRDLTPEKMDEILKNLWNKS